MKRTKKVKRQFFVQSIKSREGEKLQVGNKVVYEGTVYIIDQFPCSVFCVRKGKSELQNVQVNLHNIEKYEKSKKKKSKKKSPKLSGDKRRRSGKKGKRDNDKRGRKRTNLFDL